MQRNFEERERRLRSMDKKEEGVPARLKNLDLSCIEAK